MNLLNKLRYNPKNNLHQPRQFSRTAPHYSSFSISLPTHRPKKASLSFSSLPLKPRNVRIRLSFSSTSKLQSQEEEKEEEFEEYLAEDGEVYQRTLRLVECAMFAAVSGLAYLISNSLSIENYFGCFFALPIVFSSMRWGIAAGRKTMVATAVLLFALSGPVKALTYLLMHGLVGFTMGSMWRLRASWGVSIMFCSLVRAVGATGYVLVSSFLIGENILALITVNIHASLTYLFMSTGTNVTLSMDLIYVLFTTLLMLNCGFFVFLLHLLYALFFTRLGMKASLRLPKWLEAAI